MQKVIVCLFVLWLPALAQKIEPGVVVTLAERSRAIEIYRGATVLAGDFAPYRSGDETRGKVAVIFRQEVFAALGTVDENREALTDALIMGLGFGPKKITAVDCAHQVHRGELCTGPHGDRLILKQTK